jgi:XTP/dITP diphosphohydrolase/tetrapyrrole methylase family protein/MazG family protein
MSSIDDLRQTMARLRAKDGCPWDREQNHQSLARCLVDECSELLEAIDRMDLPHMREELGDVLIQIVFHARLAEEEGQFDFDDVARDINEKLIRRHPHVFGPGRLETSGQVLVQWDKIKSTETKRGGPGPGSRLFKSLPPRLPALLFADAVWKQVEKGRLPTGGAADRARIQALANELTEETLGRALFELAAAARQRGIDPEGALRRQSDRVMRAAEDHAPREAS